MCIHILSYIKIHVYFTLMHLTFNVSDITSNSWSRDTCFLIQVKNDTIEFFCNLPGYVVVLAMDNKPLVGKLDSCLP